MTQNQIIVNMTTEEKAKAYDEALEQAATLHRFSSDLKEIKRMEDLFPQLKESESEDERIREAIIEHFKGFYGFPKLGEFYMKEIYAWLEKQGEQKPVEWSKEDETKQADSMYLIGQFRKHLATDECSIQMAKDCVDWLKSLSPKKQWKPTEEQLGALVSKLPLIKGSGDRAQTILETLYEQLKSL